MENQACGIDNNLLNAIVRSPFDRDGRRTGLWRMMWVKVPRVKKSSVFKR